MSEQEGSNIAGSILKALYDAWERHTVISLNSVQEQGGWERSVFRTVVDRLEKQHGLIKSYGSSYSFQITPEGILYAEENEIAPKDKAEWHRAIRQHILAFLADLYDREGSRAHAHYEKIAEGAPVTDSMKILRDLPLLVDLGYAEAASVSSFRITDEGMRYYRGTDYEDILPTRRPQQIRESLEHETVPLVTEVNEDVKQSAIPTKRMAYNEAENSAAIVTGTDANVTDGPLLNNRYKILTQFPTSGFGQTFLAEDMYLPSKRKCVIKRFAFTSNNPETYQLLLQRFEREAATLERLAESNEQIPNLFAHFSEGGQFYLVQEYVRGETVAASVAASGPFNEAKVRELLVSILHVLEYVHAHSVIHRDIKPENIVLREGDSKPFLIDFGAVKEVVGTVVDPFGNPSTTIVIGTLGYMPPEQVAGRPVFASDLYCLSLTAIYMLTGKRPQELTDLSTGDIAWRNEAREVSSTLAAVLDKSIQHNYRERFPSARAMLEAITASQDTRPSSPTPQDDLEDDTVLEVDALNMGTTPRMNEPGRELVRTWIESVITPVIRTLEQEQQLLSEQRLRWDDQWDKVEGISSIRKNYDPNWRDRLEQFERFYPDVGKAIDVHDRQASTLQERYQRLLQSTKDSPELRALYERAVSPESLAEMGTEMKSLFNFPENVDGHLKALAEHTINRDKQLAPRYTTRILWERYGSEFLDILSHPPLKDLVEEADASAGNLLQSVKQLLSRLKEVRETLSLKHDVSY